MNYETGCATLQGILPYRLVHAGKVRELYSVDGPGYLLLVATNRLSTHNIVHMSPVPYKGMVLNALTVFWLSTVLKDLPHHLVLSGRDIYSGMCTAYKPWKPEAFPVQNLHYFAIVVTDLGRMIGREFILRSYLAGSLYAAYKDGKDPYDLSLPPGLTLMSKFPGGPVFTPTEKSKDDDPVTAASVEASDPDACALWKAAYERVEKYLATKGIALVDSKGEMGRFGGWDQPPVLADELFTPDSSRFVELADIVEGKEPEWLDKQIARDEAARIWGKGPKSPIEFRPAVIEKLSQTYLAMLERITGHPLREWQEKNLYDASVWQ